MAEHQFEANILREYDIRGTVGKTLFAEDARALGQIFAEIIREKGGSRVAVGRDGRLSSPELAESLIAGLAAGGVDVTDIGLGPTPMLYFAVHTGGIDGDFDGGIMVTGSHNPSADNGFKIMLGLDPFFGPEIQDLARRAAQPRKPAEAGAIKRIDITTQYLDCIAQGMGTAPNAANLKVVWDCGNGAAGQVIAGLIERLPGTHLVLNEEVDGRFPAHHPDPTIEENLLQLRAAVCDGGFDLGIGFDGDGDRIGVLDQRGRIIWGDQLLALLARDLLREIPGATIIADVKSSQVLFDVITEAGGKPIMHRTGHSHIKRLMKEVQAPLAGEMSGHIIYADKFFGFDDALYVAVRFLDVLARNGGDAAALLDSLPIMINTPEIRIDCPDDRKFQVVAEVQHRLRAANADVNEVDGVRVMTAEGWWLLRASNTQPVLVARCEAASDADLAVLKQAVCDALSASAVSIPAELR